MISHSPAHWYYLCPTGEYCHRSAQSFLDECQRPCQLDCTPCVHHFTPFLSLLWGKLQLYVHITWIVSFLFLQYFNRTANQFSFLCACRNVGYGKESYDLSSVTRTQIIFTHWNMLAIHLLQYQISMKMNYMFQQAYIYDVHMQFTFVHQLISISLN